MGRAATEVLWPELLGVLAHAGAVREPSTPAPGLPVDARVSDIVDATGHRLGRVAVLRDVSDLVQQRETLAALNLRLA